MDSWYVAKAETNQMRGREKEHAGNRAAAWVPLHWKHELSGFLLQQLLLKSLVVDYTEETISTFIWQKSYGPWFLYKIFPQII